MKRLVAEGKTARGRQLLRERETGAPTARPPIHVILVVLLLVVATILVIVIKVFDGLLERVQPIVSRLMQPFAPLLLSPSFLAAAGVVILVWGLQRALKYRRQGRFRGGIISLALAFITFWPLQFIAARVEVGFAEYRTALHALAAFLSVCLLTGGLKRSEGRTTPLETIPGNS